MLEKWKNAVIHLESATDEKHFYDKIEKENELEDEFKQGNITPEEFNKKHISIWEEGARNIRIQGTALFISHKSKRYLLTARHVVFDEKSAQREFEEEVKRVSSYPKNMQEDLLQSAEKQKQNKIFDIIFRVPSLNEIISENKKTTPEFLMNLGAGTTNSVPYTFSPEEIDLAIISLDQRNSKFADELIELGYEPISSEYIIDGPTSEGTEVFTVGYPMSVSVIGSLNKHPAEINWSSSFFSLPNFSFGKVSMLHDLLTFFWIDTSIYPGNSGGPVIENDKLVGIVSQQAALQESIKLQTEKIDETTINIRIPFGRIIKAKYLWDLIKIQEKKDNYRGLQS